MAESTQAEPSIEEILASIRKIISDDDGEADAPSPTDFQAASPPANESWHEDNSAEESDDVLELTDVVAVEPVAHEPSPHEEIQQASYEQSPEQSNVTDFPQAVPMTHEEPSEPHMPSEEGSIITGSAMAAATGAFAKLSHETDPPERTSGDGRTVEDITRELLRPMLREWMDHNLAQIVERLVERELRKISRKAEDL